MYLFGVLLLATAAAGQSLSVLIANFKAATQNTSGPSTLVPFKPTAEPTDDACTLTDGRAGKCVYYYQCDENSEIKTGGEDIISIRINSCSDEMVCCILAGSEQPTKVTTTTTTTTTKPVPPPQPKDRGCGWRNTGGLGARITLDDLDSETDYAEFPWMVAVYKVEDSGPKYVGGGTLIHPNVVMTAAHIVNTSKPVKIRAGVWSLNNSQELYPIQERNVDDIVRHKDFNKGTLYYDIALLMFNEPITLAENVRPACLPKQNEIPDAGTKCTVTGWGSKPKVDGEQHNLRKLDLPVIDHDDCQIQFRKTRVGEAFQLHRTFMCAGGEKGKDACRGDGGSPLACPIEGQEDRYTVNGIVAWGIGCGDDGVPGAYVSVAKLRKWVEDKMIYKNYILDSY